MAIKCRPATIDDLEDINVLQQSSAKGAPFSNRQEIIFKRLIEEPVTEILVIEKDLYVVGLCQLSIIPTLSHGGRSQAIIGNVLIDPLNRRQGLCRVLLSAVIQKARKAGCYQIVVFQDLSKDWQKSFLTSLGFSNQGGCFVIS